MAPPDLTQTLAPAGSAPEEAPGEPPDVSGIREVDDPDRYDAVGEHARGGLGRIVRAVDKRLGRTVAVKELLRRGSISADDEARFLREALITARLEHPGIVPVHEAGRWPNGDPYYVMKLVEGRTLKEAIAARPTLRERMGLLEHVIAIADAVGYAHSEGVIHRDLKPSNVIVGEFGETIVVDWGLARDRKQEPHADGDPHLECILARGSGVTTVSGKVVGTPAYMAPEQARGELVDERADVYAIGTILYELLAGTPPHHDQTPQATLDRVLAGPPRPIAIVVPTMPSELATIVAKAMARQPEARYGNASALAEDLRRFQTGKLVSAHSYTTWSLVRKRLARHRGVVAVAVASAVALGGIGVESFRRVVTERNIARSERGRAVAARSQAETRQRELVLMQAKTSLEKDPTASLAWLRDYDIEDEERSRVLDLIDEAVAAGVARHVFRPGDWVHDAAFTPDGKQLVAAVRDGVIREYDVSSGTLAVLGRAESAPEMLAMSPTGDVVITGGILGEVTVWPLHGGPGRVIAHEAGPVMTLAVSPDGASVLARGETGPPDIITIATGSTHALGPGNALRAAVAEHDWTRMAVTTTPNQVEVVQGGLVHEVARIDRAIQFVALSPRGEQVVFHDGEAIYSVPFGGGTMKKLAPYDAKLVHIEWSPDEQTLAVIGEIHDIVLLDATTGARRELRGHTDALYTVEWTRDGRRLLSASDDGTARVWTVSDGSSQVLRGHDDDVYRARFSPDEASVATSSLDGSVRVWSLDVPGAHVVGIGSPIDNMTVEKDHVLVKFADAVESWNLETGAKSPMFSWAQDTRGLGVGVPSPDGQYLLVPSADNVLEVRQTSGPSSVLRGHTGVITEAEFSPDEKTLFTSSYDGTLRRWDLTTATGTILEQSSSPVRWFALAKDGRVAVQTGNTAKLLAPDGTSRMLGTGASWCMTYAEFDSQGRLLMRRCDHSLAMLDGERIVELPTDNHILTRIAVSPDGKTIAAGVVDRTVRLWDAHDGHVIDTLHGHTDLVMDVAFSPDGRTLASASYDKTVRVWDLSSGRQRVLRGHSGAVNRIAWRDAGHLVTSSRDGTVRMWDVPALELPTAVQLVARIEAATTAHIDVDRPTTTVGRGT